MSYIGNNLQVAYPSYTNIDDISGSFDSVTTSFALTVGGVAPVPAPLSSNQCMISVGGVIQRPDDTGTEGFRLSGGNIVFSSAPNTGEDFFGVILAGADYVNVGVNYPSGTAATPSITFDTDLDTGIYNPAANELGITTAGASRLVVDSSGNVAVDTNTLYVDATNNRVGVGTTSPASLLHLETDGTAFRIVRGSAIGFAYNTGTSSTDSFRFQSNSGPVDLFTAAGQPITFSPGTTERARIDSSGRLLVGTSSSSTGALLEVNGRISGTSIAGHLESFSSTSTSPITLSYTVGVTDGIVVYIFSASSPSSPQTPGQYLIWRENTGASVNTIAAHSSVSSFTCNGSTGALTLTPNTSSFRAWKISITKVYG